jgi:hypothetical protein
MKLEELFERSLHVVDEHRARILPLVTSANEARTAEQQREAEGVEEAVEVLG